MGLRVSSLLLALFAFGWVKGKLIGSPPLKSALRMVLVGALAGTAAFLLARLISVSAGA